jgi:hypothetical protein
MQLLGGSGRLSVFLRKKRARFVIAAAAGASLYGPVAFAQPSNAKLMRMVQQQASQIKQLKQRLDALEKQRGGRRPIKGRRTCLPRPK